MLPPAKKGGPQITDSDWKSSDGRSVVKLIARVSEICCLVLSRSLLHLPYSTSVFRQKNTVS
jgi:hypothetical protein